MFRKSETSGSGIIRRSSMHELTSIHQRKECFKEWEFVVRAVALRPQTGRCHDERHGNSYFLERDGRHLLSREQSKQWRRLCHRHATICDDHRSDHYRISAVREAAAQGMLYLMALPCVVVALACFGLGGIYKRGFAPSAHTTIPAPQLLCNAASWGER